MEIFTVTHLIHVDLRLMLINKEILVYPRAINPEILFANYCAINNDKFIVFDFAFNGLEDRVDSYNILAVGLDNIREYLIENDLEREYFELEVNLLAEMRENGKNT